MKASAESAPLCTCQVLSVGASINLHGCLLLAEGKALCEGISEVCASMLSQGIQCWCKHQAEELSAGSESTGTLDKEVDAIRVNLKGFPDTEFFRVEVSYLT